MMQSVILALLLVSSITAATRFVNSDDMYNLPKYHQRLAEEQMGHVKESRRKRLPTQPMHRSILEQHKRSLRNVKQRTLNCDAINAQEGNSIAINLCDESANASLDEQQQDLPLLTSPWWNRIHEDYGTHSYNFIPESRRAASSVVFLLERDRDLAENEDSAEDLNIEAHLHYAYVNNTTSENQSNSTDQNLQSQEKGTPTANVKSGDNLPGSKSNNTEKNIDASLTNASQIDASKIPFTKKNITNSPEQSKTHEDATANFRGDEYMIISGGYTDHDWKTFPVYAFPLTTSIVTSSGRWIDLSPLQSELLDKNSESWCNSRDNIEARDRLYQQATYLSGNVTQIDPWENADSCAPSGRMGHSSFVYKNYLYVFGGLIYDAEQIPTGSSHKEGFRLEDVPYVYRLDLREMFEVRDVNKRRYQSRNADRRVEDVGLVQELQTLLSDFGGESDDRTKDIEDALQEIHDVPPSNKKIKGWQRIIPRVKAFESFDSIPKMSASEVLLKSINRGEMQGGMWNEKYIMYGGLRIVLSDIAGPHTSSKVIKGDSYSAAGSSKDRSRIIELPLGDVWAYDLTSDAFEKVTNSYGKPEGIESAGQIQGNEIKDEDAANYNEDDWLSLLDASTFPRPRTAHAATIVGDNLIIHGGMGWDAHVDDWNGLTKWENLDDMWILDSTALKWTRRYVSS